MSVYQMVDIIEEKVAHIILRGGSAERERLAEVLIRANNTFPQREWYRALDHVTKTFESHSANECEHG